MLLALDCPPHALPLPLTLLGQLQIEQPFDLKPVGLRSFTTDTSSAVLPGDISMLVGLASMLRQTSNSIDWQDDDFVRTMVPAVVALRPEPAPGINREAVRENLLEVRRLTGFTWDDLADLLQVDRRTLHNWSQGGPVRAANQTRLASLLGALRYIDRGTAESNRIALSEPGMMGVTPLALLSQGRFQEAEIAAGRGLDRSATPASAEAQLTDLRIRPLGIGYFSSSPDALDLSDDAKPPHQPARSQRVQKKRG
jgi:DNA-binding XRE family transcriptional regulator